MSKAAVKPRFLTTVVQRDRTTGEVLSEDKYDSEVRMHSPGEGIPRDQTPSSAALTNKMLEGLAHASQGGFKDTYHVSSLAWGTGVGAAFSHNTTELNVEGGDGGAGGSRIPILGSASVIPSDVSAFGDHGVEWMFTFNNDQIPFPNIVKEYALAGSTTKDQDILAPIALTVPFTMLHNVECTITVQLFFIDVCPNP